MIRDSTAPDARLVTTIAQAINDGAARLQSVADSPRREARLLLAHALSVTQNDLIRDPARPIDPAPFQTLLSRRVGHEPLALITGYREFWSMDFAVSSATLIPRPDSETLIEAALTAFAGSQPPRTVLDLGTGTGCLLLSLLAEFPSAFGVGVDISQEAAGLAKANSIQLGMSHRSGFVVGNWIDAMTGHFDLIICNPPYIRRADIPLLMPEVALHEPNRALDGGMDGYDAYRMILSGLRHYLAVNGKAILELGHGQANYVSELAQDSGLQASFRLDLAEIPRAIVLTVL